MPTENCKHVGYTFLDFYQFVIGNNFVPLNNLRLRFCFFILQIIKGKEVVIERERRRNLRQGQHEVRRCSGKINFPALAKFV